MGASSAATRILVLAVLALTWLAPAPVEATGTTKTPTPTPTKSAARTKTPTPTPTKSSAKTPTPTATKSVAARTKTPTPTPSKVVTPTRTATTTATTTPTATATRTPTVTPTRTRTPTPAAATRTPVPSATATPAPPPINHLQCYEAHRPPLIPATTTLEDVFGPSTVRLKEARRICLPVDKNDEDDTAPSDPEHVTYYTLKQLSPRFTRRPGVTIRNQFGIQTVDVVKPDRLMVPTVKSLVAPPALPPSFALDHFKCYRIQFLKLRLFGIQVEDQFGATLIDLKKPIHLCAPANKNGEGIADPSQFLMCYQTRLNSRAPRPDLPDLIYTTNQIESDQYEVFGVRELCVPSEVLALEPF